MPEKRSELSRRERQIMDIIYSRNEATAADVVADLPDAPSYSTVRALLRILEDKGMLRHREEGPRYIYSPTVPHEKASKSALTRVLNTFFEGSLANAVAAFIDAKDAQLSPEELQRLESIIKSAKQP